MKMSKRLLLVLVLTAVGVLMILASKQPLKIADTTRITFVQSTYVSEQPEGSFLFTDNPDANSSATTAVYLMKNNKIIQVSGLIDPIYFKFGATAKCDKIAVIPPNTNGSRLQVIEVKTGMILKELQRAHGNYIWPSLSPDGSVLTYFLEGALGGLTMHAFDLVTGIDITLFTPELGDAAWTQRWSKDSEKTVVQMSSNSATAVYLLFDLKTGKRAVISSEQYFTYPFSESWGIFELENHQVGQIHTCA